MQSFWTYFDRIIKVDFIGTCCYCYKPRKFLAYTLFFKQIRCFLVCHFLCQFILNGKVINAFYSGNLDQVLVRYLRIFGRLQHPTFYQKLKSSYFLFTGIIQTLSHMNEVLTSPCNRINSQRRCEYISAKKNIRILN